MARRAVALLGGKVPPLARLGSAQPRSKFGHVHVNPIAQFREAAGQTTAWLSDHEVMGLTEDEASDTVANAGLKLKVVVRDGQRLPVRTNRSSSRINVEIVAGRVSRVDRIG